MRILQIICQKPGETGSGMYIRNLIYEFNKLGHKQALICGIEDKKDIEDLENNCQIYEVTFNNSKIPFHIVGMSDVMPYKSTKYRNINEDMQNIYELAFKEKFLEAVKLFKPDYIIAHHLYFLTSLVVDWAKDIKVIGFCHGTDIRQFKSHTLKRDFIKGNIKKLHKIFALHEEQKREIEYIYEVTEKKIIPVGVGYNENIFYNCNLNKSKDIIDVVYTGKVSNAKGVNYLVQAFSKLEVESKKIRLNIIGMGIGDEFERIIELSKLSNNEIRFLGKLTQVQLNEVYNKAHIFILPSLSEGLPLVLIEALSCGLRVITSDLPGIKGWFGDEINNSGNIMYIDIPKTELNQTLSKKNEEIYIENIKEALKESFEGSFNEINLKGFSWSGVAGNIDKHLLK